MLKHNDGVFEDNTTNNSLQLYSSFIHEDWSYLNGIVILNCRGAFSLLYFQIVLFFETLMFSLLKERCQDQLISRPAPVMLQGCPCPVPSLALPLDPVPWGVCLLDRPLGPAPQLVSGSSSGPMFISLLTGHPQSDWGPGSSPYPGAVGLHPGQ